MSEGHDLFWGDFFGIEPAQLRTPGWSVVPHAGLAGYRGVWFFLRGTRLIVSAPDGWLRRIRGALADAINPLALPGEAALVELFGSCMERWVGPAFHGSLEARDFRPFRSAHVRSLTESDSDAVTAFRKACGAEDWNDAAFDKAVAFRVGFFKDARIVAMAGFRRWSATAGDPCVLTLPDLRRRGSAKAVVGSVLDAALAHDQVPLYQTLEANAAAVGVALSLGYARYANHIAVRLTRDEPPDHGR